MKDSSSSSPALTLTSMMAALVALLVSAFLTQWAEVILYVEGSAEMAISLPAATVLSLLIGLTTVAGFARLRLLTKAELVAVYFIMAIAAPLMSQGFWQRIVAMTSTIPREQEFGKYDSLSPHLWPHGENQLAGAVSRLGSPEVEHTGSVSAQGEWLVFDHGTESTGKSTVRFPLSAVGLQPGEAVLFTFQLKPVGLSSGSLYSSGFRNIPSGRYFPVIEGNTPGRSHPKLPEGVTRLGRYGIVTPAVEGEKLWLEISFAGPGRLEIGDLQLVSVAALENFQSGLQRTGATAMGEIVINDRSRTVQDSVPGSFQGLLQRAGIGLIPWHDWATPILHWTLLLGVILTGSFGVNLLMRRRWINGERVPLPMTRIPLMMIGLPLQPGDEPIPFWRNRLMWCGFIVAFLWAGLKGWHFYNPGVPDLSIEIPLRDYFDPSWGSTWAITLRVSLVILALSVFADSAVLLSVIVGLILYRLLFSVGMSTGWSSQSGYPYAAHQQLGGFLTYAALLVYFARKQIISGLRTGGEGERTGLAMVILAFAGGAIWGMLNGISPWQLMLWVAYMLAVLLIAARFRAECVTPVGTLMAGAAPPVFFLLGGFAVFSHEFLMTTYMLSFVLMGTAFMLIPGAQFEYLEIGRRLKLPLRQLIGTSAFGVLGGVLIGGFAYLLVMYSYGAASLLNSWTLNTKIWYFSGFNAEVAKAAALAQSSGATDPEAAAAWAAVGYGSIGTVVITVLRQLFSSFWLHPFGFIIGSSPFAQEWWGTLLVAWMIRTLTIKIGGAQMLRYGLQPVFGGVFLGALAAWLILNIIGSIILGGGTPLIYNKLP